MKKIFIVMQIFLTIAYSQEIGEKMIRFHEKNGDFSLQIPDENYSTGDTLFLKYSVRNNSNSEIILFSPFMYNIGNIADLDKRSESCEFYFDVGGEWYYKPGYRTYLKLIRLGKGCTYETVVKLSSFSIGDGVCNYGSELERNNENTKSILLYFRVAYVPESDKYLFTEVDEFGYQDFLSDESGIEFMDEMNRILLGPLLVKYSHE